METQTNTSVEALSITPGFHNNDNKRKHKLEESFDLTSNESGKSQIDEATRIRSLVDLAVAMQGMGLLESKEVPQTIIMGPQSSGKSAMLNNLLSYFIKKDILLAPSASGRCTKSPLFVELYNIGEDAPIRLQTPGSCQTEPLETFAELRRTLATIYGTSGSKVSLKKEDSYKLRIKSDVSFTFVDTPGPIIPEVDDLDATARLWQTYYESIIGLDSGGSPLIVSLVDLTSAKGSIDSEPSVMCLKSSIASQPQLWKNCSIMIAITHIDVLTAEHRGNLVETCKKLESGMSGVKKVMFAVTQLKKVKKQNDGETSNNTAVDYYGPLETIEDEKKTHVVNQLLANARNHENEPLFIIGIENIAKRIVSELGKTIVGDQAFLNSLFAALDKRIDLVSNQISLVESNHSLSSIGVGLYHRMSNWDGGVVLTAKLSKLIRPALREQAEKFFVSQIHGKKLHEGFVDNPTGQYQVVKFVTEHQRGEIWRDIIFQILDHISLNETSLIHSSSELLSRSIQRIFNPYLIFDTVKRALAATVSEFKEENLPKLHKQIQQHIRDMKETITVNPALDFERVINDWPTGSKFIEACRFDILKESTLERDILLHLDVLLDWIEKTIVMKLMVFKKDLTNYIGVKLSEKTDPIPEMTPEARNKLAAEKEKYEMGKEYIRSFHPTVGVVKIISEAEPEKKRSKLDQIVSLVWGK